MQSLQQQESVGLLIAATRRRVKQVVGSRVRRYGISPQQFWILVGIAERRGLALRELAEGLRLDAPTASRIVTALADRGWVEVAVHPEDRRRCRLQLTPAGRALSRELVPLAREVRTAMVKGLTAGQREMLRSLLRKIVTNMDRFERGSNGGEP